MFVVTIILTIFVIRMITYKSNIMKNLLNRIDWKKLRAYLIELIADLGSAAGYAIRR